MNITLNGKDKKNIPNSTLEALLIDLGYENKKIAVEVNNEIIPRSQLRNKLLVDGDKIEIINAVGGG